MLQRLSGQNGPIFKNQFKELMQRLYKILSKRGLQKFKPRKTNYNKNYMEIQKHLFRIAERSLKGPNARCFTTCAFLVFLVGCIYYSAIFIVGTLYIVPENNIISECFKMSQIETNFTIQQDSIYMVFSKDLGQIVMGEARKNNQTVADNSYCTIIKGLNTKDFSEKPFEFTWTPNVLYLTVQQRNIYNFNNYTIALHSIPSTKYFFYGMNTLLTNELIHNLQQVFLPNVFIKSSTVQVNTPLPPHLQKGQKLFRILKCILYYVVVSFVTSLYIYGTIIAAPAVIIMFLRCTKFVANGGNMTEIYKIFPWIGMHSLIRQSSQNQKVKKSSKQLCSAIIFYFFFLYFVYYAIILQLANDLFYQKSEQGLEEMLFGFVALVEFMAIVFMRTRPFIKYYPLIHTLLITVFLVYCQFVVFGLKKNLMMIVVTASLTLFSLMVMELEIPAQTTWNRAKKYTPTAQRTRIGFLPLFNINWINNLPDEWTMMFPLFGRQAFTQRELAFADRNFQLLDGVLGVNQNGQNNQQGQHQQLGMAEN